MLVITIQTPEKQKIILEAYEMSKIFNLFFKIKGFQESWTKTHGIDSLVEPCKKALVNKSLLR